MKRILSMMLVLTLLLGVSAMAEAGTGTAPKYIFFFIGDGMSTPQVQAANYYLNALEGAAQNDILKAESKLSFLNFPVVGAASTFDSSSFCPDSASTATSMASGHKTYSGVLNMDESLSVPYETIAEQLKDQLGYQIGILSSVNLNHATPAAFYAHQPSRGNYYEIGQELLGSGFDFFAGGGLLKLNGKEGGLESLYDLAEQAGYSVIDTQAEAEAYTDPEGKVIMIHERLADSDSMPYALDLEEGEWALKDYVQKGIDLMYDEAGAGFFMMVEGGKIDWACHANDAASTLKDVISMDEAVQTALGFYEEHPEETLILVTGDHETGGLTIGYAGTNYDTFLDNLAAQKLSYAKFDSDYVANYKENQTPFETVLQDVETLFGLKAEGEEALSMSEYELETLRTAYERTLSGAPDSQEEMTEADCVLYGSYEPLTVTLTHILNHKSGVSFTSYAHTGLPTAVYAIGNGAQTFDGCYDNTEIYAKLAEITGIQG